MILGVKKNCDYLYVIKQSCQREAEAPGNPPKRSRRKKQSGEKATKATTRPRNKLPARDVLALATAKEDIGSIDRAANAFC